MEVQEAIARRRSIRSYTGEPVSDDLVQQVIQAGLRAPSSVNQQAWAFVVVRRDDVRSKLVQLVKEAHVVVFSRARKAGLLDENAARERADKVFASYEQVPVWIVAFRVPRDYLAPEFQSFERDFDHHSVAAALENMMLTAASLGLGTCWTGSTGFLEADLKTLLNAPARAEFVALTPLGYPQRWPDTAPARRPYQEVVFLDAFS